LVLDEKNNRYSVRLADDVIIRYGEALLQPSNLRCGDVVRIEIENELVVGIVIISRVK
jgi:hypothetical protein